MNKTATTTTTRVQTIENASLDDVSPGDHITWTRVWERDGVAVKIIYEGIAHHRGDDDDWWTKGGMYITNGEDEGVTITIRRPVQELPDRGGIVIVTNDGCEAIEAVYNGIVYHAREAVRTSGGLWLGAWRAPDRTESYLASGHITPGTWQVEEK